ncbi:hypothetical protein V7S43_004414 [Phytophthora oleae]|uniref:Transposase n=1 Tax=Phytophthora oleae TaxID=2107226 RepID=A0ABD3FT92_9STRA
MARVAVDAIAKRIVLVADRRTGVAYGDWSRRGNIKGHASSPVKGLKEALRKRAVVFSMDEFRTSKLCSQCDQSLSPVRYAVDTKLPKRRKRKGVVLARNRAEVQFKEKGCHGVLRCNHATCPSQYWDRDVNAAKNILSVLQNQLAGVTDRPLRLQRTPKSQPSKLNSQPIHSRVVPFIWMRRH